MSDLIINHALRNVWCTPRQDKQLRIKVGRLTSINGVRNFVTINGISLQLPSSGEKWHVYQFGQIHFELFDITTMRQAWTSVERLANRNNVLMEVYTDSGKHFPLTNVFIIRTLDNNYLMAVKPHNNFSDPIPESTVYFRTYSNAYYNSIRSIGTDRTVTTFSSTIVTSFDLVTMSNLMISLQEDEGHTYAFVNGYYIDTLNPLSLKIGDYVEIVRDASVKTVIHIPVSELQTFTSTLDQKIKYLIRGNSINTNIIEYEDDIDIFLSISRSGYRQGVSYVKNAEDAMRMVTHKDYAIPTTYLQAAVAANDIFSRC